MIFLEDSYSYKKMERKKTKSKFKKGCELDKQIYLEGTPTWGCKLGVLDVEDVKDFINEIKEEIGNSNWYHKDIHKDIFKIINQKAGEKLI